MGSVPSAAGTQQTPWHGTGCAQSWHMVGPCRASAPSQCQQGGSHTSPAGGYSPRAAQGGELWVGEGGHRHPLLTAGPQQLVQHGQRVQAYLENQVGEEEEDAGPQQSFEDAAGVTCETRATCHPAPKDTSNPSTVSAPSGRAGKGALCPEIPRLCPRDGIPPGLCPAHRAPSTAQGHPKSQSPGPPSLPVSLQHPAGTSLAPQLREHTRMQSASPCCWNVLWEGSRGPPHPKPRQPFHQLQPCPHPTRLSGPCARFPGQGVGWAASPPQLRAGLGAAPGQQLSLHLFFPVNPHESSRQRRDPGPCEPMKYSEGKAFSCGRARRWGQGQSQAQGGYGHPVPTCPGVGDPLRPPRRPRQGGGAARGVPAQPSPEP